MAGDEHRFKAALAGQRKHGKIQALRGDQLVASRCNCRWIIFYAPFLEVPMAIIDPDLKPFMSDGLLNDDVDVTVMVDVHCRDDDVRFRRLEIDIRVIVTCEVQFQLEATRTKERGWFQKQSSVGFVITIKIGDGEPWTG